MNRALAVLFLAACSSGDNKTPDLSHAADLATTFCAGTALAGTCAPAFLAPLAACFDASGACTITSGYPTSGSVCYADGARLDGTSSSQSISIAASHGGAACFTLSASSTTAGITVSVPGSSTTLGYDNDSGTLTCPDGSTVDVGSQYAGCSAFKELIDTTTSSCTTGTCP